MHRVLEAEQLEMLYDCAERCKRCKEISCKQPAFVEVVYCPRYVAADPHPNSQKKHTAQSKRTTKRVASLLR